MKTLRSGLIACIAMLSISATQAQTADEIIAKHNDAIGGKDILSKIKSIYMEGAASAMGNDYPTKMTMVAGKGFKTETSVNGMEIIQCITDTSGWMINPLAGQTDAVALPAEVVKKGRTSLDVGGELYNYKDKGFTASLEGREDYQGVSVYKIKLSKADMEMTYHIDPNTYYILKTDTKVSMDDKDVSSTTTFSNYKKTDFGYVLAYTMGVTNMGYDVAINYTKVEINKEVDPAVFAMPK